MAIVSLQRHHHDQHYQSRHNRTQTRCLNYNALLAFMFIAVMCLHVMTKEDFKNLNTTTSSSSSTLSSMQWKGADSNNRNNNSDNNSDNNNNNYNSKTNEQGAEEETMNRDDKDNKKTSKTKAKKKRKRKNTQKDIAFLTLVDLSRHPPDVFTEFIFPALDTWLDDGSVIHVAMLEQWKERYQEVCSEQKQNAQDGDDEEDYCDCIEPLWVDDCGKDDSTVGIPSCCKAQNGLRQLQQQEQQYNWYVYAEPFMYLRKQRLLDYTKDLDHNDPIVLSSKTARAMGYSDYDGSAYNCTDNGDSNFWYSFGMPTIMSRGALNLLSRVALRDGGMVQQCQEFGDTSADLGLQILDWMHSIPALQIPLGHKPIYDNNAWFANYAADKKVLHQLHHNATNMLPPSSNFFDEYNWHKPTGFRQTELYRKHGDPSTWEEWHLFTTKDCWLGDNYSKENNNNNNDNDNNEKKQVSSLNHLASSSSSLSIAVITYTHLHTTERFEELIFPSLTTWMKEENGPFFVVLNNKWRQAYESLCHEDEDDRRELCERVSPVWVDCVEGYYGPSPCCKTQKGLLQVFTQYDADWYIYMDDDMYLRLDYIRRTVLSKLDPNDPALLCDGRLNPLGTAVFRSSDHECSWFTTDMYPWGQPVFYNRGALQLLQRGLELGAIEKECSAFGVTHDVGNQIVHWMYSLPVLRGLFAAGAVDSLSRGGGSIRAWGRVDPKYALGFHGVGHNNLTMQSVHTHYTEVDKDDNDDKDMLDLPIVWHNVTSYKERDFFDKHGDPRTWQDEWQVLYPTDCGPSRSNIAVMERFKAANQALVESSLKNRHHHEQTQMQQQQQPSIAYMTFSVDFPVDFDEESLGRVLDSWLPQHVPLFIVMDKLAKHMFYDRVCGRDERAERMCGRIIPVWVECARTREDEVCLVQEGLVNMHQLYDELDWTVVLPSETYILPTRLQEYLRRIDPLEPIAVMPSKVRHLDYYSNDDEMMYECSWSDSFKHPLGYIAIYSRGALSMLLNGLQFGGLKQVAATFHLQSLAPTLQIYNWMYSLPTLLIPVAEEEPRDILDGAEYSWKHDQAMAVIRVYDERAWKRCHERLHRSVRTTTTIPTLVWYNVTGFHETRLHREHQDPSLWKEWNNMTIEDCQDPK